MSALLQHLRDYGYCYLTFVVMAACMLALREKARLADDAAERWGNPPAGIEATTWAVMNELVQLQEEKP